MNLLLMSLFLSTLFSTTVHPFFFFFFFFNDTATTEIYTLSLHDALPICLWGPVLRPGGRRGPPKACWHPPRCGTTRRGGGLLSQPDRRGSGPIRCRPFSLLQFLGWPLPHEHEDCRLRDHQVLRSLERDLHRRFPEEQGVVPGARLHREILHIGAVDLPRLVIHAGRLGHGRAGPRGDDASALDLAGLDGGRRPGQADVGALPPLLRGDEASVAGDDQARWRLFGRGHRISL